METSMGPKVSKTKPKTFFQSWPSYIMAFENFKPKYLFNLCKQVTKINKAHILKAIQTITRHKKEGKRKKKF